MILSGFVGGLFIFFRPFAGILGLVFLLKGNKKWIIGCIAGFIIGCSLFVLPNPSLWKDYFKAMSEYGNEYTGSFNTVIYTNEYEKPTTVEGTDNLGQAQEFNLSGLNTIYSHLKKMGIIISKNQSYLLYILLVILLCIVFYRNKGKDMDSKSLFLFAFLLYILAELFVMAPRNPYNLIQWIFPLSLIFLQARYNHPSLILLIAGLLLLHNFPFVFPYQAAFAELLFIGVAIYYSLFVRSGSNLQTNTIEI